jgi:RNA polymerase sigma-54 factor
MALEIRQQLKLTQQLIMTPQLQQAIKLLQLSRLELLDTLRQEIEVNPLLEETQEGAEGEYNDKSSTEVPEAEERGEAEGVAEITLEEKPLGDLDWETYFDDERSARTSGEYEARDLPPLENTLGNPSSLTDHLLWQVRLSDFSPQEALVAEYIIGNLDKDGYLKSTLEELAAQSGMDQDMVGRVLSRVQGLDPAGVAARDLSESLLIQINHLGLQGTLMEKILKSHLSLLETKNYGQIAKQLGVPLLEIHDAVRIIQTLDPKPGLPYNFEEPQYISPDIYVYKVGEEYIILLNEDGLPRLRINNFYREALTHKKDVPQPAREFIQNRLRSAIWLIKSIQQRQRTIYRVAESIVKFQREFLDHGIKYLKPMVLRDVAEDVEMHESTISRVTTNKYMHTPQGLLEMKFFFNSSISKTNGDQIASESVKGYIRKYITQENPMKPLSDQAISNLLRKDSHIDIARRTVAKYRETMGFLPSSRRKDPLKMQSERTPRSSMRG